ncbi:MAG: deoxyhypusine synthase [Candidatus Aenigmarchaeota archaeon ex4484_224]|nr:MAG: deoxyhypusine synthase [Candidatus Aenigmarchaeota archaeon ex4484_224]
MRKVDDFKIERGISFSELINQYEASGGFSAKDLAKAAKIVEEMIRDKESINFISFPADIIATGTRGIIREMVRKKWFDVIITTCGTLDHDLARSFRDYYHGSFLADDWELRKKGIHRLGNIFVPKESYGEIIEEKMQAWLKEIYDEEKKELASYELIWELGKRINNENSILFWAYKNKIPVIVPGITDGAVGYQIWFFWQNEHKDFSINLLKDEQLLNDIIWEAKKSGALILGGGISKHHTIWWNQFKEGLDYVVYISTAVEWDGSLSGARPREAVSWNKVKEESKMVFLNSDITIALPLIYAYLVEVLE